MTTTPAPIDWEDYGIYDSSQLPTDWEVVVNVSSGGGYDWTIFRAFWSPTERRYFWRGGSGCSCNSWGQGLRTPGSFGDGNRDALGRALRAFVEDYDYSVSTSAALAATQTISTFKEN